MVREGLKSYNGKVIEVIGNISGVRHQGGCGGSSQICIEDIHLYKDNSFLTDHAWFSIESIEIAKGLFNTIREICKTRDLKFNHFDWDSIHCRWDFPVGKKGIDNRKFKHKVVVKAKVKKYKRNLHEDYGFGYIEGYEIYLLETETYYRFDKDSGDIIESKTSMFDSNNKCYGAM